MKKTPQKEIDSEELEREQALREWQLNKLAPVTNPHDEYINRHELNSEKDQ